ncbi:hypothetical protein HPB50_027236 [Hyalomma asiaticum]|uniref:Uncharacterized protein n=1 Tax=Hyalomma asiaticum TaxID=266040 RepID=A0ACB7SAF1_HYAAI|nr:hypothetical protein HPB50_027236 [Hyalomma asiaticum]
MARVLANFPSGGHGLLSANGGTVLDSRMTLGDRGTYQGVVLSPFLLILVMRSLFTLLDEIPSLRHTIYPDDVTLWTTTGSDGQIEFEKLFSALSMLSFATHCKWESSDQASSLADYPRLGRYVQSSSHNTVAIERLTLVVTQTTRLIARVSARKQGMKEKELLQLIHAFVKSSLMYALPHLHLLSAGRSESTDQFGKSTRRPSASLTARLRHIYSDSAFTLHWTS